MAYEQHEWVNGETITAAKMNNIEEGIAEAAQSGGGYDLILTVPWNDLVAENVTVVSGNILECEQKVADGELVNAVLLLTGEWSYVPSGMNSSKIEAIARLTYWSCGDGLMTFSAAQGNSIESTWFRLDVYNIAYDAEDGSIVGINNPFQVWQ